MKQAGLNGQVSIKSVASGQPSGTVASTKPAVGSVASSGTTVIIYVSKGGMSVVPDVSGKSVSDATATLLAAGFSAVSAPQASQTQFFQHSATIPKGMVVGTDPAAGSSAQGAGAVLLIISLGP
jgi:beta-lactam-binding protein with PASTA domain